MKNCGTCKWYKVGEIFGICTNTDSKKRNKDKVLKRDKCKCWEGKEK